MTTNIIPCKNIINIEEKNKIKKLIFSNFNIDDTVNYITKQFKIQITSETDIIKTYERDYSNISGNADLVCQPSTEKECAIILNYCYKNKTPITISAGRTNLNGSATPNGGMVIAINKMIKPSPKLNSKTVTTAVGIYLEKMRNAVLKAYFSRAHARTRACAQARD